jgi:hypothetical protein
MEWEGEDEQGEPSQVRVDVAASAFLGDPALPVRVAFAGPFEGRDTEPTLDELRAAAEKALAGLRVGELAEAVEVALEFTETRWTWTLYGPAALLGAAVRLSEGFAAAALDFEVKSDPTWRWYKTHLDADEFIDQLEHAKPALAVARDGLVARGFDVSRACTLVHLLYFDDRESAHAAKELLDDGNNKPLPPVLQGEKYRVEVRSTHELTLEAMATELFVVMEAVTTYDGKYEGWALK